MAEGVSKVDISAFCGLSPAAISLDGTGIRPDKRKEIFQHAYTTDVGTGFVLSAVSELIDAHDWDSTATEAKDGGARFEIYWSSATDASSASS